MCKVFIKGRINEIITFEKAVMTVTAKPITMAGLSCVVTAKAEHIPSTCISTGLLLLSGARKTDLFCFENQEEREFPANKTVKGAYNVRNGLS